MTITLFNISIYILELKRILYVYISYIMNNIIIYIHFLKFYNSIKITKYLNKIDNDDIILKFI